MIAFLMLLGLTVCGGVFAGTILHSLSQTARLNRGLDMFKALWL